MSEASVRTPRKAGNEKSEADNEGPAAGPRAEPAARAETADRLRAFTRGEPVELKVAAVVPAAEELHKQARCLVELLEAGHVPLALLKARGLERVLRPLTS